MTDLRIPRTPDTLTRAQVINACKALGLDPNHVKEFRLTVDRLDVELFAVDPDQEGRAQVLYKDVQISVSIPVEWRVEDL